MWKLTARSPRRTAKLAALATKKPASRITRPSSSRGRNTPTCDMKARRGSSITSTLSIAGLLVQGIEHAAQRNAQPVGPVAQLVAKLVQGFLQHEQAEQ